MEHLSFEVIILVIFVVVAIVLELYQSRQLLRQKEKLDALHESSVAYCKRIEENEKDIQNVIKKLESQKEELLKFIDSNSQKENQLPESGITYCSDTYLNVFMNSKKQLAHECGVQLDIFMEEIEELPYDEHELVSLLGNLLDNAIEACMAVHLEDMRGDSAKNREKPYIILDIRKAKEKHNMFIYVENVKRPDCHPVENHFSTTKEDKNNHGKGIPVIHQIVNKYNGKINFSDKGETFQVAIEL